MKARTLTDNNLMGGNEMKYDAITGYEAHRPPKVFVRRDNKYARVNFLGSCGNFDSLPVWQWEEDGTLKSSYSQMFFVPQREPEYHVDFWDVGDWNTWRTGKNKRSAVAIVRAHLARFDRMRLVNTESGESIEFAYTKLTA
jgi:hypothetical protein